MRSRGFSAQRRDREQVFDMGGFKKFEAAKFDERDVAAAELDFEDRAVMAGAE